jgi:hypothetical protein
MPRVIAPDLRSTQPHGGQTFANADIQAILVLGFAGGLFFHG